MAAWAAFACIVQLHACMLHDGMLLGPGRTAVDSSLAIYEYSMSTAV
eukprot:SAG25_NODE_11954_length_291_cov_0.807292_1_plen_46_part_01